MPIIALVNQKGGTGKSTAAVHLCYWLNQKSQVVLVDADAQQSSSLWFQKLQFPKQAQHLIKSDPEELFESLPQLAQQFDYVVVDGPGSLSEITKAILARCDLALVPCQPSGLDLHSSSKIIRFIRHAQELRNGLPQASLFLSRATKGTTLLREAQEALKDNVIPLMKGIIYQRQCVADAPGQGSTVFQMSGNAAKDAAQDYKVLFQEALEMINHGSKTK
jgi:chromosome partitioning protein